MIIKVGCKNWSKGSQVGLRVYAESIRALAPTLIHPSRNTDHGSLQDFLDDLDAGGKPVRYSRNVILMHKGQQAPQPATATFATLPPTSVQGYITAQRNTWFHDYITKKMDKDIEVDYQVLPDFDLVLLP